MIDHIKDLLFQLRLRRGYLVDNASIFNTIFGNTKNGYVQLTISSEVIDFLTINRFLWRLDGKRHALFDPIPPIQFSRKKDAAMFIIAFGGTLYEPAVRA